MCNPQSLTATGKALSFNVGATCRVFQRAVTKLNTKSSNVTSPVPVNMTGCSGTARPIKARAPTEACVQ